MDSIPLGGRLWMRGGSELTPYVADLLSRHLETRLIQMQADVGIPRPGDLVLDFSDDPEHESLTWCRDHGVCYLAADWASGSVAPGSREPGPTMILGHGEFGLISHFVRIAIRDVTHKFLRGDADEAQRAELTKLLRAENYARLAALAGVHEVHLVAPNGHLRLDAARALTESLTVQEQDRIAYRPKVRTVRSPEVDTSGSLGILLRGRTFGAWWTGSRLDAETASGHVEGATPATLQRAVGVLAAAVWVLENPRRGVLTPGQLPHEEMLEVALPYLGVCESRSVNWRSK